MIKSVMLNIKTCENNNGHTCLILEESHQTAACMRHETRNREKTTMVRNVDTWI